MLRLNTMEDHESHLHRSLGLNRSISRATDRTKIEFTKTINALTLIYKSVYHIAWYIIVDK